MGLTLPLDLKRNTGDDDTRHEPKRTPAIWMKLEYAMLLARTTWSVHYDFPKETNDRRTEELPNCTSRSRLSTRYHKTGSLSDIHVGGLTAKARKINATLASPAALLPVSAKAADKPGFLSILRYSALHQTQGERDSPIKQQKETNIPPVEISHNGRRPTLSHSVAAKDAQNRFQMLNPALMAVCCKADVTPTVSEL